MTTIKVTETSSIPSTTPSFGEGGRSVVFAHGLRLFEKDEHGRFVPQFHCPRCGGLLRRKNVETLLDQLPCKKCGYGFDLGLL